MKSLNGQSLRCKVEKWLAPAPAISIHVTRFSRNRLGGRRCVYVETSSSRGVRALFFFRHDDGTSYVFPPAADGPRVSFSLSWHATVFSPKSQWRTATADALQPRRAAKGPTEHWLQGIRLRKIDIGLTASRVRKPFMEKRETFLSASPL
jgi:hypothetical protein